MKTEQQLLAEFKAFFEQAQIEANNKVEISLNVDAVKKLKSVTAELKSYSIEDVTPNGYGI
jgi:hypothetical protein